MKGEVFRFKKTVDLLVSMADVLLGQERFSGEIRRGGFCSDDVFLLLQDQERIFDILNNQMFIPHKPL